MMWYYLPQLGHKSAVDGHKLIDCGVPSHHYDTAADAASDFHNRHDGWECDWPQVIVLVDEEGRESKWSVDREARPYFIATEVK